MSTYVTAIVAGEYHAVHQQHRDIPLGLYCRQSLAQYFDPDEIFEITRQGFDFFERRFGVPYPFGKYDQLYVPEFASGAMENIACVTHNERMIYRSKVTDAQHMYRAQVTLHEMAHMWFGNLVTMKWWGDLWLNESFAEYMGYLGTVEATRFKTAWTEFANDTKTAARRQDQLPTTHAIVADIPDVESITLNLDRITYNKGAAALQQLVTWVGEDAFFKGVQQYFTDHAYGNTELADFLAALEKASGRDLRAWSAVWLQTAGVNTLEAVLEHQGGAINSATLRQSARADHPTLRPHRLRVGLFDSRDGRLQRRRAIELDVDGAHTPIAELAGTRTPDLVLVNDQDLTYCKIRFDPRSLETLRAHLRDIEDPVARALAWGALWDMARDSELSARDYIEISLAHVSAEAGDASTLESLISRIESAVDNFSAPDEELIARELARDPTDEGQKRAATARATVPLPGAKKWAWDAVVHGGVPSLSMKLAIAQGFHHVDHQRLLSAYVKPYFDCLMPVWESHDSEEAIDIARSMYPRAVITREVVEATDAALARGLPAPLRRALLESQDAIKRALRAQELDSAETDSPRGA
jgi:aminopeptidase N